jgi:hypothetical protein
MGLIEASNNRNNLALTYLNKAFDLTQRRTTSKIKDFY